MTASVATSPYPSPLHNGERAGVRGGDVGKEFSEFDFRECKEWRSMMEEEEIGIKFIATVTGLKGLCHANHEVGQKFELNCYDSGGLCGFFYHDLFPYLNAMQFGGKYPWWERDLIEVECPDRYNTVSLRVERKR